MGLGNPLMRVWEEVYQMYRKVGMKNGIVITDLVSAVLLEASINRHLVISALMNWFPISYEEASRIATDLEKLGREVMRRLEREAIAYAP